LPVILNPLQQARQQLAARQKGAAEDPAQPFNRLVLQAGSGMPFMAGTVERLTFVDGTLQLSLLADARRSANDKDKDWQAALAQVGISATADDEGWLLRPSDEVTTPTTALTTAEQKMNKASLAVYRARWQRFSAASGALASVGPARKRMVGGMAVVLLALLVWVALIQPPLKKSLTGKAKRRSCVPSRSP
jgi:hypothetical protein